MKKNKSLYVLSGLLVLASVAFSGQAFAENSGHMGEDHGKSEQAQEAHMRGSKLEVHISNSGKVNVQGAKVTAVTGNTLIATTTWGVANINWSVNLLPDSRLIRRFGGVSSVSEITVGDIIGFQGNLVSASASPLVVNATTIKDWSIMKKEGGFNGVVSSVDLANSKFVLSSTKNGNITVVSNSSTKLSKGDATAVLADVLVGTKLEAKGVYDSQLKVLNASDIKLSSNTQNENH